MPERTIEPTIPPAALPPPFTPAPSAGAHQSPTPLRRAVVVGTSCSGKTTLARRLAAALNADHIELDALHWLEGWVERDDEQFRRLVRDRTDRRTWVADGNYAVVRDLTWGRADLVVWLNYPLRLVIWRALRRTIRRSISSRPVCACNRETLRRAFLSRDSILLWVLTSWPRVRREYRATTRDDQWAHLTFIELRNPRQTERWLRSLEQDVAPR